MGDLVTSIIRTVVPAIVGAVLAGLSNIGVELDAAAAANLAAFLTALFGGLYYVVIRVIESRWPKAGILLGSTKKPEYYQG